LNAFAIAHGKLLWYDQLKFKVRKRFSIEKMTINVFRYGYDYGMVGSILSAMRKNQHIHGCKLQIQ